MQFYLRSFWLVLSWIGLFECSVSQNFDLPNLIPYRKDKVWGFCDTAQKMKIQPQFQDACWFEGNIARVRKGGWGLIHQNGTLILNTEWDEIQPFCRFDTFHQSWNCRTITFLRKDKLWGLVSSTGKLVLEPKYTF
ncbi:MAG: WG repeat-containing protein, partial [Bacteroidia bacterium]|nr:WG repeat-containing protein [Bacteroidia bacterium]